MEVGEGKLAREAQSMIECFLSLSGKPDHDISSQPEVRNHRHGPADQTSKLFDIVRTIHGRQDRIVSALNGDVEIGTELR